MKEKEEVEYNEEEKGEKILLPSDKHSTKLKQRDGHKGVASIYIYTSLFLHRFHN